MKYDLFISYSRRDFEEVNSFVNMLKTRIPDLNCWFDVTGIESGDEFEDKIISAIDNSEYVIFALSDNSLASEWTKDEVMYAKNTGKKVIPLLLKGAELKGWFLFRFGRIDYIDITAERQVEKLINNLSSWSGKPVAAAKTAAQTTVNATVGAASEGRFEIVLKSAGPAKLCVTKVIKEAMEIYMKVVHTSSPRAEYLVGVMYHNGKGCTTDYEEAFNWWKLSADQGYKYAIHYVGYCYEYGRGTDKDINKAKEYYKKAAALGYEKSKEELKRLG